MSIKKTDKPRRQYDDEFKRDVLKMVLSGRAVTEVAASLGINANMIHRWKSDQAKACGVSQTIPDTTLTSVSGAEYERVKARLREVEQERDILKKALGIFSRGI